ncbi:caspase family protein [Streptomyces sp. NPDC051014]|uniref:VMAP-C domain-containing protein n=1 Tax=Streptomyces sp. NPDC051014 TaxID=3155751 RepID=UPI003404E61E
MDGLDPQRVFALVVGIESYQIHGWSLPGPARDAVRFADWLTGTAGVPQTHVRILLSPLREQDPPAHPAATAENVHRALFEELPERDGDLLWIYWAGHGFLDFRRQLLLPCADATIAFTRHLNLQAALRWWQSANVPGKRFHRVVAVGDTCRVEARTARTLRFGINEPEAGELIPERRQFVLYAARAGEAAKNQADLEAGQFTDTLLKRLDGRPVDQAVEDLADIAGAVRADFQVMRANGTAWQEPQFVISEGWDGSALFGDRWSGRREDTESVPPRPPTLDQDAWSQLGPVLQGQRLPAYSYDAYRWAFEATGCTPPPGNELPGTQLLDVVRDLDSRQGRRLDLPLALPFIRFLAARARKTHASWADEADSWVDRTRERLGAGVIFTPPEPPAEGPALHLRLVPDECNRYWTRMWLYQEEFENIWESSQSLDLPTIRDMLGRQLAVRRSNSPTRIEFHLPYGLLDEPFESWKIPWRGGKMKELGCYYDVVLRCPEERQGPAEAPWYRKWEWLQAQGGRHPQAVREVCDSDVSDYLGSSLQETEPPVVVLAEVTDPMIMDTLDAVLDGGVPIAVWRRPVAGQEGMAEPIRAALTVNPGPIEVHTLPAMLRTARIRRRPLALMWDDPGRIPERQTLTS